jgi:WXXGXW repeat (2 copies)
MKKYVFYLVAVIAIAAFSSCAGSYIVRERPAEVVYSRPVAPSREYIWISGDWFWIGGRYEWREGHWDRARAGNRWREGYWQNTRGGYKWHPGHWQRY